MQIRTSISIAVWLLASAVATTAPAQTAATLAQQGNGKGAVACSTCHGADGGGQAAAGFPRLAGLDAAYLQRQLDALAGNARGNTAMAPIAKALTEDQRHALAEYYSHMPIPSAAAQGTPPPANDTLGEQLATRGRWSKQVPACDACHGPGGVGVGANFPPLAGQSATYLANQLRAFKQGTRRNDPLGLMQHVASALDDADIQAVSEWFAAQPAVIKGAK